MTIQFNTDKNIAGSEELNTYLSSILIEGLDRFSNHITRLEVHISDENSNKGGQNDKRCLLEAKLENMQPMAVSNQADTIQQAVKGAVEKMKASLDTIIGRTKNHQAG